MLNYKRLAPRSVDQNIYTHNNEKITHQEADMINNGTFIEGETSVPGEYITAQEVVQKLAAQNKHVNYMIGGDELNELVCYYTWSSDTIDPTGVHIPDLEMTVEDRKLLAYEITPENADVTSAVFSIVSGSDIAHIDGSYIIADKQGTATYKVVINGSIEDTATINVSNKPEEFPDDQEHRWIRVQPGSSQISVDGGTINVTGSYGLTGSYGTEKKVGDITDTIVIESNPSQDPKSGSKTYYYNNNQFDTPTAEITWTQPGRHEEFPDDEEHRWIEVSPTEFTFPADGGSVDVTGSYGLTGTFGTRKKIGDISDTITVDANVTASSKSGSKTYYYNNDSSQTPTIEVSWTQPNKEEEFPEEWTYIFHYNQGNTANDNISEVTEWTEQYRADGQKISFDDGFILRGISSYRTKTGTLGTVKKENVTYTGSIGKPSGYNYSDQEATGSGTIIQNGSNKQLTWSYTQEANVKVWDISADPTSLHFEASGGTQSVSVTTWYTWQTNDNNNQKFDETTTQEEITAEANTSTQWREWAETITKNDKSVTINCTQDGQPETFMYKYEIHIGKNVDSIKDKTVSYVWDSSSSNNQGSQKKVYIKAVKNKVNSSGTTVSQESAEYILESYTRDFISTQSNNIVTVCPKSENTSYTDDNTGYIRISIKEDKQSYCTVQLIQSKAGVTLLSGDAVQFTYNWDKGTDLDQATTIELNSPEYVDYYLGYKGTHQIYDFGWFAGDNTGTGNEYSFIDFTKVSDYIINNSTIDSTISGKNLIESLQDENGVIKVVCNLYTNWYRPKETENIKLQYTMFNRTSDDAKVEIGNKVFNLTGYTQINSQSANALCFADSYLNPTAGAKKTYTLSAKFIYYLNSGVVQFETNKDNVGKWQKGVVWNSRSTTENLFDIRNVSIVNDASDPNHKAIINITVYSSKFNNKSEYFTLRYGLYDVSTDEEKGSNYYYATSGSLPKELTLSCSVAEDKGRIITVCPYIEELSVADFSNYILYHGGYHEYPNKTITLTN